MMYTSIPLIASTAILGLISITNH